MNYLQRLIQEVRIVVLVALLINNILLMGVWYATKDILNLPFAVIVVVLFFVGLILNFVLASVVGSVVTQPLKLLWRNILHVSPSEHGETTIPKLTAIWLGKDLVSALTGQVYQLAMVASDIEQANAKALPDLRKNFIANSLPLPLIVLDKDETILFANMAAQDYFGLQEDELTNHNLRHTLNMVFSQTHEDLDTWLAHAKKDSATAANTWESVRLQRPEGFDPLQFDLAAFYNRDNPDRCETMLVLFDRSTQYAQDDEEVGFVALAVHELRTPITMLRGYIEALDEELSGQLSGETADFFNKLNASSQQL
ncbi:MAG: hypothetical protein JWP13_159, partial [Candidatus Saccharibacteria bacterium]|nr:hypothetical protein [Candidatus Saccharibacteria bacterium]